MFGSPKPRPQHAHVWHLIWTYKKATTRQIEKKARLVVDGSKHAHKGAKSPLTSLRCRMHILEHCYQQKPASHQSWHVKCIHRSSCTSQMLHIQPYNIFCGWWINHKGCNSFPEHWVLQVNYALQVHPKVTHFWEHHIVRLLYFATIISPINWHITNHAYTMQHTMTNTP